MPELVSYVFKPKDGFEVAKKVLERFCNDFLHYEHEGFYFHWRTPEGSAKSHRPVPEGHIEFLIETESGNMEVWTETCFEDRFLDASDLTESFFAVLPPHFWYTQDDKPEYHFYERELSEVVAALSAVDSRVVSFGGGRTAWAMDINSEGKSRTQTVDLLDYVLTVPIVKENKPQTKQLALSL